MKREVAAILQVVSVEYVRHPRLKEVLPSLAENAKKRGIIGRKTRYSQGFRSENGPYF